MNCQRCQNESYGQSLCAHCEGERQRTIGYERDRWKNEADAERERRRDWNSAYIAALGGLLTSSSLGTMASVDAVHERAVEHANRGFGKPVTP